MYTREQAKLLLDEVGSLRYSHVAQRRAKAKVRRPSGYGAALRLIKGYETALQRAAARADLEHGKIYRQARKAIIFGDSRKRVEALIDRLRRLSK